MKKNRQFLTKIVLLIFVVLLIASGIVWSRFAKRASITSFEACMNAGYPVGESHPRQCWTPDGKHFVEDLGDPLPAPGPITTTGEISCLPKIGNGPQTMECAIGLLADDGQHYGLTFPEGMNDDYRYSQGGLRLEIIGKLVQRAQTGPDGNRYDIAGIIEVEEVKIVEGSQE